MDRLEQIRRSVEWEMMEKRIQRLESGPPDELVYYFFRAEKWLRMTREAAAAKVRAEYATGMRHELRTKEAILAFLQEYGIPHEVIDHDAELYARVDKEAHRRMKAAALNRRRMRAN